MSACDYTEYDGAYVLGSLSPTERQDFERHLATCKDCARSVRELAGLPGLLARVDPVVLENPPEVEPLPETLLPALFADVRRSRQRRRFTTVGLGAAAAAAVGAVVLQGTLGTGSPPAAAPPAAPPSSSASANPVAETMQPVGHVPVQATLAFTSVKWGTKLDLTCSYDLGDEYGLPDSTTYGLFVVNRDGTTDQVGTWRALRGRTMQLTAGTASRRSQISSVEVRTADGRPVLKLT